MFSRAELVQLIRSYTAHSGMAPYDLSRRATGNNTLFIRLLEGKDCLASSLEDASAWFVDNWPGDLRWPLRHRSRTVPVKFRPRLVTY